MSASSNSSATVRMSSADAPRPWMQMTASRARAGSAPRRRIDCPRCGSLVMIASDYARDGTLAAAAAGRVARYLRDAAHVDADCRQGLPRADAAGESLLEHHLSDFGARPGHAGDANRP